MNMKDSETNSKSIKAPKQHHWLIYVAAVLSGLLLLADAANYAPVTKITARLGIALLYTAFAFMVGKARASTYIGTALLWIAVVLTFVL
jgi:hypothetical protein